MGLLDDLRLPPQNPTAIRRRRLAVRALVVLAAIGGALAGAHPTGLDAADVVLTAVVAGGVTALASRARSWTWSAATAIALVASNPDAALFGVAAVLFVAAVAITALDVRNRVVGAALGAMTVQVLLRLPAWGPFGLPSLLAGVAMALLVVSGFRNFGRSTRRRVVWAAVAALGLAVVATALFAIVGLQVRGDLDDGIAATRRGINAARTGDTKTAAAEFDHARELLASASDSLDAPWARFAGVVPVVGQHEEALRTLTRDATRLTATGAGAARDADVKKLRVKDGRLDLAEVEAMRAPLIRVDAALADTQGHLDRIDSQWLLGPVRDQLDRLRAKVDRAAGSARTARLGIDAAPVLLGREKPARFLLLFTTPSEARASGFMGNWGILTADKGKLDLTEFGRASELRTAGDPLNRKISGPADFLARYGRFEPEKDLRNVTLSPDFPTVARVAGELSPQVGLGPVDGVMAIDPEGIAALLKLTGPVQIPGRVEPLTAENAADFLLHGQYEYANPDRIDFLEEAARAVTDALTHGSLPGPRRLGKTLGPAVRGGHLLLSSTNPTGERLFRRLGADGKLAPPTGDYAGLVTQNAGGSKIDFFLHRSLRYDANIDPSTGAQRAVVSITLDNRAPTSGQPPVLITNALPGVPVGANHSLVSFYSYLALDHATLDGQPVELRAETERGLNVYTTLVTIPSGATAHLILELRGAVRFVRASGDPALQLTVGHQVMVNPDQVDVNIRTGSGWSPDPRPPLEVKGAHATTWSAAPTRRVVLRATLSR